MNLLDKNILLIDKPSGITSFDVIRQLRVKLGIRKMGHAGTLDPKATGLMIIGVEKGTKKLKDYIGLDKTYEAEIFLGIQTDTGDLDGTVIKKEPVPNLSEKEVKDVLDTLVGKVNLPVPIYSAIKKQGKPLYKYAREGKHVEVPIKRMKINWVKFVVFDSTIRISINVSSGTYIRSIAEELGIRLNTVATLKNLRRIEIGKFHVRDATSILAI